jgi:hypothetical protein
MDNNNFSTLVRPADIKPISKAIDDWDLYLRDGDAFLHTAMSAYEKRRKVFTPEILYNIIAMAIEKFVMAALMQRGALPWNHTMGDLVEAMEEVFPAEISGIKEGLIDLDRYQEICDVDSFSIIPLDMEEIPKMLALAEKMQALTYGTTGSDVLER